MRARAGRLILRGVAAGCEPWSPAEDDAIRRLYPSGVDAAMAELPRRTRKATMRRAQLLGVYDKVHNRTRWTPAEDKKLGLLWDTGLCPARIAIEMGRTEYGVYVRAYRLGLQLGVPDGYEYFTDACNRTGFHGRTLWMILGWAGVAARVTQSRSTDNRDWRHHFVDPDEVDDAVKRWLAAETVNEAATSRGIPGNTLRYWLKQAGLLRPATPGSRKNHRIPTEDINRVVKEELRKQTARRVRVLEALSKKEAA